MLCGTFFALLIILSTSCHAHAPTTGAGAPAQVILGYLKDEAGFKRILVLDTSADVPQEALRLYASSGWIDSGVVSVRQAVQDLIHNRKHVPWSHQVIAALGAEPVTALPQSDSFRGPRGPTLLSVSAPGYSLDSTVAAVYWSYECGKRCAGASVTLFKQDPSGAWKGWRTQLIWIS